ncbi:response regulator [Paenibacillus chitinolyticus]|uniref:response regulator n=1 Tax=Paenibacillus chitinolyticus TaxID=79263 RepID=UPI001C475F4A|nr:response regulator [Paenibacillus chitinolyticus]MBV6715186.1 response regulator [Paenibacillus chitinolyticus]
MRKLLIVDDEKNIRLGVSSMIRREFAGTYEIELASDGEEALRIVRDAGAHIVITDIRMPGMDGIALLRELQTFPVKPLVFILSGHDDFAYAKEAIRNGVKGYLLKPIVREELYEALRQAEKELDRQEARQEAQPGKFSAGSGELESFHSSQLNYILMHPEMDASEIRQRLATVGFADNGNGSGSGWRLGLLRFPPDLRPRELDEGLARLERLVPRDLQPLLNSASTFVFMDKDRSLVLLAPADGVLRLLRAAVPDGSSSLLRAGVSREKCDAALFKEAYREALSALRSTFIASAGGCVQLVEELEEKRDRGEIPREHIRQISNKLGTGRLGEIKALLAHVLDARTAREEGVAYVEAVSSLLNKDVFDQVFHTYGEQSVEILRIYKKAGTIDNFEHYHEYADCAGRLVELLDEYVGRMKQVHVDHIEIKRAVKYMEENYARDLNMAMVSNYVSLNYTYFSKIFKEYTGDNFVGYLKKIRISRAKELLESSHSKVYEIAEQVGFENTKLFTRVFKEKEGITPQEYRAKRYMEG